MSERQQSFANRRKQADWVVNAASALSVASWIGAIAVLFIIDLASPETGNFFTNVLGDGTFRTDWDTGLLPVGLVMLVVSFLCSVAAFIFNMMRMRRKTDKYRKSVIIMGLITLAAISAYVIRFGQYLF